MPCSDVTEILDLQLDAEERIKSYTLTKRTCGAEIGWASLLQAWLERRTIDDVLATDGSAMQQHFGDHADAHEFFYAKHLVALQEALRAYRGDASGASFSACALESVQHDDDGTHLCAHLRVDLLTERITACSHCGRCGVAQPRNP